MKRYLKILFVCISFGIIFLVQFPKANAVYNSKYLTETAPEDYYASLDMSKTGEAFRRELSVIISKNFNHHSYKTNDEVLKQTDPDPNNNGNVICFYTGQSLSGGWNKEHVWAKSHGFPNSSSNPYCDAHHLRPTQNNINSSRGNSDFGELDGVSGVKTDNYGNRWTSSIFEPRDEVKGDVARIMFYMATRYGFDGNFNLTLVNDRNTSTSTGNGKFGGLQTLIKWHYEDPVSDTEIYRNNVIYDDWQHNRNPYIDHPEYVDLAYPNSYTETEVDDGKVLSTIEYINRIPSIVTLESKEIVMNALSAYNALNYKEKEKVVNYTILKNAIETLNTLEENNEPLNPEYSGNITINFNEHTLSDIGYTNSYNFEIDQKKFYASSAGIYSKELRIGSNKDTTLDSKYGISEEVGVVLEQKFDVSNAKQLTINISNKYGTLSKWYVLFKETGSTTYQIVSFKEENWPNSISASLPNSKDGSFVLILCGKTPRMVVSTFTICTEEIPKDEVDFSNYSMQASILATVTSKTLESAQLRLGICLPKEVLKNATKFGILLMDSIEVDEDTIEEYYDAGTYNEFKQLLEECGFYIVDHEFTNSYASVDASGKEAENGEYAQFSYVINNILGNEKNKIRAVVYIEINNKVYFTEEIDASFQEVLKGIDKANLSIEEQEILEEILNILN